MDEKRIIKLWTKNTIENLEDMIECGEYNEEEVRALKITISILERKMN